MIYIFSLTSLLIMAMRLIFQLLILIFITACNIPSILSPRTAQDSPGKAVQFFYESRGGTVEGFFSRPEGEGRFPLIVLLHGHSWFRTGAKQIVPVAEEFSKELCYATLAVSLPGYGLTHVPGSGTDTQSVAEVILDGIANIKGLPWVDGTKVMLYGFSRGASFAAIIAAKIPRLQSIILHSGAYDITRLYRDTSSPWLRRLLNPNGEAEPFLFDAVAVASDWKAPTLILHGGKDQVIPPSQAVMLHNQLEASRKPHRLVIFPDSGHRLPPSGVKNEVVSFLKQHVGSNCLNDY